MNRRALLAATGMATAAALAGCTDDVPTNNTTEELPETPNETPKEPEGSLPEGTPSSPNERLGELVAGNAGFAVDLHDRLTAGEDADNVFVSPYSISVALAMTYAGAGGDTETAMRETLGFSLREETHPAFAELQNQLDDRATTDAQGGSDSDDGEVDAFQLAVANALWGAAEYPFAEEYLDLVDEHYNGGFNEADFANDPEVERERINEWVAESTEDRIEDLIPEDALSPQTVLVLTNAIYFMAGWQLEFDPEETTEAAFSTLDGSESAVSMMEQNLRTNYADLPGAQAIELPYVGGEVSMVLIVPDQGEFEAIQAELSGSTLFGVFEALGDASGDLRMPKFEYEFDTELSKVLTDMGMEAAFGPGADFTNMVDSGGGPGIDDVFHKAFVSVDEEGTEAAAATSVSMIESAPAASFDLTVDRPFLFCIRDRPTDAVLFLGRVTDVGAAQ
jgi:serpin B